MISDKIHILEFPTNLGLKKKKEETEPGVRYLPDWLNKHGFHKSINPLLTRRLDPPVYSMDLDTESNVRNANKIIAYAIEQSKITNESLKSDAFLLILGGDCSVLIGSSLALKQNGNYGLFFLDGHTDYIGPRQSQTGGAAGMDLAIATGFGHDKLTNIINQKPYLLEENVYCVGNREYDEEYVRPILESKIGYYDLKNLRANGISKTTRKFLDLMEINQLDGFFIHLDVDVLNDDIMPAVDSRARDGLSYQELRDILIPLLSNKMSIGLEITILDPNLDPTGLYTIEFVKNITEIVKLAKANTT